MTKDNSQKQVVLGRVVEALPNTFFKVVREDTSEEIMTYLSGKMRLNRIRVLIGDKVEVEIDQYGGKGRISRRL